MQRDGMTWEHQELTLAEFYNPPNPPEVNRAENDHSLLTFDREADWGGMSKAETMDLPGRGWPAGVDAALRLLDEPELAAAGAAKLVNAWNDDDGETLDVARFFDGLPCWQAPHKTPGKNGGRIITLVIHGGANARTTADQIAWKAYAAVRYVDAMEAAGYRVAVDMSYAAERAYADGTGWTCTVHVKDPDQPVDLSQIAAVLSAAAFRWYGFTWEACHTARLSEGRGKNYDLAPEDDRAVYLPARVKSRLAAQDWLADVTDEKRTASEDAA